MDSFNIDDLKLKQVNKNKKIVHFPQPKAKFVRVSRGEKFLRGPIPLKWLTRASKLPGKALQVGIAIWYLTGLKNSNVIKLTNVLLADFGVNKDSKRRALKALEEAGLISIEKRKCKNPIITILDNS